MSTGSDSKQFAAKSDAQRSQTQHQAAAQHYQSTPGTVGAGSVPRQTPGHAGHRTSYDMTPLENGSPSDMAQQPKFRVTDSTGASSITNSPSYRGHVIHPAHAKMEVGGNVARYPPFGSPSSTGHHPAYMYPYGGGVAPGWSPGMGPPSASSSPGAPRVKQMQLNVAPTSRGNASSMKSDSQHPTAKNDVLPKKTPSPTPRPGGVTATPPVPPYPYWGGHQRMAYGRPSPDGLSSASIPPRPPHSSPHHVQSPAYSSQSSTGPSPGLPHHHVKTPVAPSDSVAMARSAASAIAAAAAARMNGRAHQKAQTPSAPQSNPWRRNEGTTTDNYSRAFLLYNAPYESQTIKPITEEEIRKAIPENASCIFHVLDRRINMDAHPVDTSFYSLLRSWIQDDPYRQVPAPGSNVLEFSTLPSERMGSGAMSSARSTPRSLLEPVDTLAALASGTRKVPSLSVLQEKLVTGALKEKKKRRKKRAREIERTRDGLTRFGIYLQVPKKRIGGIAAQGEKEEDNGQ